MLRQIITFTTISLLLAGCEKTLTKEEYWSICEENYALDALDIAKSKDQLARGIISGDRYIFDEVSETTNQEKPRGTQLSTGLQKRLVVSQARNAMEVLDKKYNERGCKFEEGHGVRYIKDPANVDGIDLNRYL